MIFRLKWQISGSWRCRVTFGAGLTLIAMLALAVSPAWAEDLNFAVGAQRVLDLPAAVSRIVIGEAGIIDATVLTDRRVQVVALKAGHTTMAIFTGDNSTQGVSYAVTVGAPPAAAAGPAVVAGGATAAAAPATPQVSPGLAQAMHAEPELAGVTVRVDGQHVVLSGTVRSTEAHAKATALAHAFGGDAVTDLTRVAGDQMVAVEIRFAAVAANTMNELGFNFQSLSNGFQGASTSPNSVTGFASGGVAGGANSSINLKSMAGLALSSGLPISSAFNLFLSHSGSNVLGIISALNGAGLTQLLAQPTLVVRSGESASFLAGGEVPIPVPQSGASTGAVTIQYHSYGVRLDVAPTVLSDRRISLKVTPEVSEIDASNGLQIDGFSVPAFRKRTTSTIVELGDGESFVIAGLIYSNGTVSESRVPFLGKIPVIGAFFKLSSNARERQEMIVIATPHLVRPLDAHSLPPLPGVEAAAGYNQGVGAMLLNKQTLDGAIATYGLIR